MYASEYGMGDLEYLGEQYFGYGYPNPNDVFNKLMTQVREDGFLPLSLSFCVFVCVVCAPERVFDARVYTYSFTYVVSESPFLHARGTSAFWREWN